MGITQRASFPLSALHSLNYVFPACNAPVRQAVKAFLKRSHIGWLWAVRCLGSRIVGEVGMVHKMTGRNPKHTYRGTARDGREDGGS